MRIEVVFEDRVGIAQEILAQLASRALSVSAVEVEPPFIYIEIPSLSETGLSELRQCLFEVDGVQRVDVVAMLPGAQRRLYLDALLSSQADPVLAVDESGRVVVANRAAMQASGLSEGQLMGALLASLIGDEQLTSGLLNSVAPQPVREITLNGEPYMLELLPLEESGGRVAGAVLTLHAPSRLGERLSALQNYEAGGFDSILGESVEIRQLRHRAARMAMVDAPLLITGETGTGKELLAHACHLGSKRLHEPFFALNCAAVPENLAESELFGYSAGSFTGALRGGKPGLLELADGGTVFLDEIGEMSPYLQAKLLRFLNDGSFRRVGGDREIKIDVRIISATHRALEERVANGYFRQDLLFRLNVLNLHMPALRERRQDILLLAKFFLARACAQASRPEMRFSAEACAALQANPWVGNVRQLQNVVFRAVTMTDHNVVGVENLEMGDQPGVVGEIESVSTLAEAMANYEAQLLRQLYAEFPSSRRLAKRLGSSHSVIAGRLKKYGIV